jgi:hypothetical protein
MIRIVCTWVLYCCVGSLAAQLPIIDGFTEKDVAMCHYNKYQQHFVLTQTTASNTGRFLYDAAFALKSFYEYGHVDKKHRFSFQKTPLDYITAFATPTGNYEVFWQPNAYFIYAIDFEKKKDSLVVQFKLGSGSKKEKTLATLTGYGRFRLLTHTPKTNSFHLYSYQAGDTQIRVQHFPLPAKSLTAAEYKAYGDAGLVSLTEGFDDMPVTALEDNQPFTFPGNTRLYYNNEQLFIIKRMPSDLGFTLITLAEQTGSLSLKHFITNTFDELYSVNFEDTKYSAATIADSMLIVASSSRKKFEYRFFNIHTGNLINQQTVPLKSAPEQLFSSPLKTAVPLKKASPAKIMDAMYAKHKMLSVAQLGTDSTTLTFCAIKYDQPLTKDQKAGRAVISTLLTAGLLLSGNFNIYVDYFYGLQLLPQAIETYAESVCYVHTRFNNNNWGISTGKTARTMLDNLIEYRVNELLQRPCAFLVPINSTYYVGWYNTAQKKISLVQFY